MIPELRRAKGDFRAADQRRGVRQWDEDVGVSHFIVIEEIAGVGVVGVHIHRPTAQRHSESDVILNVAFARQGSKAEALRQGKLQQRAAQAVEWGWLIVIGVVAVHRPPELRDADAAADARVNRVLAQQPTVVRPRAVRRRSVSQEVGRYWSSAKTDSVLAQC